MNSAEVITRLRGHFCPPEWAFLEQCGNGTGSNCRRWADVIVMNLWPSRGLEIIGIEVKVSRSDWLSELKHPEKADAMAKHCDSWYVAVPERALVQSGELPKGWGLLVVNGSKVKYEMAAERKEGVLSRNFFAAVLRRVQEQMTPESRLQAERKAGLADGRLEGIEIGKNESRLQREAYLRQGELIKQFELASGVKISNEWNGEPIGLAVKAVLNGGLSQALRQVEQLHRSAENCAARLKENLEELKKAQ